MTVTDAQQAGTWSNALGDIRRGIAQRRLCYMLALDDIRRRYRRSVLGPFWLTLSMGLMVGAMGLLYGTILNVPLERYFPFLAVGLVFWTFISTVMAESTVCFVESGTLSRQMPIPWSLLVARLVLRNLVALAHNMAIIVLVLLVFRIWPGMALLALPFTLLLLTLFLSFSSMFLAVIGARFRDMGPIIQSALQVTFFVTPILWLPASLASGRSAAMVLVDFNPVHHLLEVVRRPLLGEWPPSVSLVAVLALTGAMALLSFWTFARARARLIFWC